MKNVILLQFAILFLIGVNSAGCQHKLRTKTMNTLIPILLSCTVTQSNELMGEISIHNTFKKPLIVEKLKICYGGALILNLFKITLENSEVKFNGRIVRLAGPQKNDYYKIEPAETFRVSVRIDNKYQFKDGRNTYKIQFISNTIPEDEDIIYELKSNTCTITYAK